MAAEYDVLVVGGGMAGIAAAARVADGARVCVLEMEDQIGHHATGRSAALYIKTYGNEVVQALTRASREVLFTPPEGFVQAPLVKPRAILVAAREGQDAALADFIRSFEPGDLQEIPVADALARLPILRTDDVTQALISHDSADIDVHELHQAYLRRLRARGGVLVTRAKVIGLARANDGWTVTTEAGDFWAPILVNAAGAWAGELAALAGAEDLGISPLKRTACLIDPPADQNPEMWPLLHDLEDRFYLKPESGKLMLSPADETPTAPCDAQAEEYDVAVAVDQAEHATTLQIRRVGHKWAGLRTFVADRSPVIGFDRQVPGFFWIAALGGFGIQTAPGVSELAARLIRGDALGADFSDAGVDPATVAPGRSFARVDL